MEKIIPSIREKAVIEPVREDGEPFLGANAIMVSTPSELSNLAAFSNAKRVYLKSSHPFKLFTVEKSGSAPLGLAGPFMGAPQGAVVMEKLIALGATNILLSGWCGSLQPNILIGDYVMPTEALSEEGTSIHYPVDIKERRTSIILNKKLMDMMLKEDIKVNKGPIWTTDAIYRETEIKIIEYQKKGLLAVEMEMSALINVALFRSVELAGLLTVSDELFSLKWKQGFSKDKLKEKSIQAGRILFNLCMNRD